jgi:hypothetical protein
MDHNFWYWLLVGLRDMVTAVTDMLPLAVGWGIQDIASTVLYFAVVPFLLWVGTFVHLNVFGTVLAIFLLSEVLGIIIIVARLIGGIVKNLVGALAMGGVAA